MNRTARFDFPDSYFHIISRGQRKNPLFFSDDDMMVYLAILRKLLSELKIDLNAFCLMRNHVHFLLHRKTDSLQKMMRSLNTSYAIYFNAKYMTVGHVFQGRFKSFYVAKEDYLISLIHYIHMNPVKAHLCDKPGDYFFSSYRIYFDPQNNSNVKNIVKIPGFLKTTSMDDFSASPDFEEIPKCMNIIGDKIEYLNLAKRSRKTISKSFDMRSEEKKVPIKEMIDKYFLKTDYVYEDIFQLKWNHQFTVTLKKLVRFLYKRGYSKSDISRAVGRSPGRITQYLKN